MIPELLAYFGIFAAILITLAACLAGIDYLLDEQDRDKARHWFEDFWYRTARLEYSEAFQLALREKYARMKRLRPRFFKLFVVLISLLALHRAITEIGAPTEDVAEQFRGAMTVDFAIRIQLRLRFMMMDGKTYFETRENDCVPLVDFWKPIDEARASQRAADEYLEYLRTKVPLLLGMSSAAAAVLQTVLLALPLMIALWCSFNLTLWLLSKFVSSHLWLAVIVVIDGAIAVTAPNIFSTLANVAAITASLFSLSPSLDFASYSEFTWLNFAVAKCIVEIYLAYGAFVIYLLLFSVLPLQFRSLWISIVLVIGNLFIGYSQFITFIDEIGDLVHFRPVPPINLEIDIAILVDILFSLTYIVPCVGLVFARRHPLFRHLFLNLIQRLTEFPTGPLSGAVWMISSVARFFIEQIINLTKR